MKKQFRKTAALAAASIMALASVMTAYADLVTEGTVTSMPTTKTVYNEMGEDFQMSIVEGETLSVSFSKEPTLNWYNMDKEQGAYLYNVDGYEWRYAYANLNASYDAQFWWEVSAEDSYDWISNNDYGIEMGGSTLLYTFKINQNGVEYPQCKLVGGAMEGDDYLTRHEYCMFVLVPNGYEGDIAFSIFGGKLENGEGVRNDDTRCTFLISGDGSSLNPAPAAPVWKEDSAGWRLVNPDGSYVIDAWYQSPESGLWYYLGSDGIMLTNTTTPDGYQVGSDGAWIQ